MRRGLKYNIGGGRRGYKYRKFARKYESMKKKRSALIQRSRMWKAPNIRTGGFLDREIKFFDTTFSAAVIPGTGWLSSERETNTYGLFCPQQGDGSSGRDGRKCLIKSIHMKGSLTRVNESDLDDFKDPSQVTIMVVWDKQTNGAQAQGETIMDTTPGSSEECMSFRNLEYSQRFQILYKRTFILRSASAFTDGTNTGTTTGTGTYFNFNRRINIPVEFSASTGAVTDIVDNSIHVYACATPQSTVSLKYNTRVRFVG